MFWHVVRPHEILQRKIQVIATLPLLNYRFGMSECSLALQLLQATSILQAMASIHQGQSNSRYFFSCVG